MNSKECFNKIVCKVNCKFGVPMGRFSNNKSEKPSNVRIFDRKVQLDSGAYDKGGAYWGFPNNLRVQYTKDLSYVFFYRAF